MEDEAIVTLYWERNEHAIEQTKEKYERYLTRIAYNILSDIQDSEESVSDTYFKAWNAMPPHRPTVLSTFLGKITRQVSIDRFRTKNREKRRFSEYAVSLNELEDCISAGDTTQECVELKRLGESISRYLRTLPEDTRGVFICRYYFVDSISEIARHYAMSKSKVKSMLYRTRQELRAYLVEEGFSI